MAGPRYIVVTLSRAAELWNEGEKVLARIHLAYVALPPCDDQKALRLFVADASSRPLQPTANPSSRLSCFLEDGRGVCYTECVFRDGSCRLAGCCA